MNFCLADERPDLFMDGAGWEPLLEPDGFCPMFCSNRTLCHVGLDNFVRMFLSIHFSKKETILEGSNLTRLNPNTDLK